MHLMVLAGGFGTRLKTVVQDVPKPLAPVGNQPFLQVQIEHWVRQGVRRFTFLLHYQAELMVEFINSQKAVHRECDFGYVIESLPLGTGGSVVNAIHQIGWNGGFILTNADTWLGSGMRDVWNASPPTVAIVQVADAGRYGTVIRDQEGRVRAFLEKDPNCRAGWINSGLYRLNTEDFSGIEAKEFSLERDLFPRWVQERRLKAIQLKTDFTDIGVPEDYFRFCERRQSSHGDFE